MIKLIFQIVAFVYFGIGFVRFLSLFIKDKFLDEIEDIISEDDAYRILHMEGLFRIIAIVFCFALEFFLWPYVDICAARKRSGKK